jgi:hypothetical protein
MAYYSFLDHNNVVTEVITGIDETELIEGLDTETWYGNFRGQVCKRTSYNTRGGIHFDGGSPFRKNFGSIGFVYDESRDAFIPPKPFNSWILDESTCLWEPPIPAPKLNENGLGFAWDEETLSWVEIFE